MGRHYSEKAAKESASAAEILNTQGLNQYSQVPQKAVPIAADRLLIEDSAALFAKKWIEVGDLPGGSGGAGSGAVFDGGRRTTGVSVINAGRRV